MGQGTAKVLLYFEKVKGAILVQQLILQSTNSRLSETT